MLTRKLAKAILLAPNEGQIIDLDEIAWKSRSSQYGTKVDIYVNDVKVETCDLCFLREYANS